MSIFTDHKGSKIQIYYGSFPHNVAKQTLLKMGSVPQDAIKMQFSIIITFLLLGINHQ